MTYRYYGHHQGDDTRRYRTKEEEETARSRDCIVRFRKEMLATGSLSQEEMDLIDTKNREKIDAAVAFAEKSPLPQPADLFTDVYVQQPEQAQQ
jgi:pyruvate dehydrogenase E1 component alpha subunit